MPGMIVHHWLARQLWKHSQFPAVATFSRTDETWNAFLLGSIAPDMGMFPGGRPLVSDLAHYVRSGDLARHLVATSAADLQLAFAWGWTAHGWADVLIHPLINRGVGQLLNHDRHREIPYADNPRAHVRVELGLDAVVGLRIARELPFLLDFPADEQARFVDQSFGQVYDHINLQPELLSSLRAQRRWLWAWQDLACIAARRFAPHAQVWPTALAAYPLFWMGKAATAIAPRDSGLSGLFRAVRPSGWFLDEFERLAESWERHVLEDLQARTPSLSNANWDTGAEDGPCPSYSLTRDTLSRLRALLGQSPRNDGEPSG